MHKILIVEDNEISREMISRRLSRAGFEVGVVENGELAVQCTYHYLPDLVLMDLNLPVKYGWTAARELRSFNRTSRIPIIALTAQAGAADRDKALAAGCDDFVAKPIDFDCLLSSMDRLLGRAELAKAG